MADFLVFTLTAPMGAFGELAGHDRRNTLHWPGKSAIAGLVGAALGIRRDNRSGQEQLNAWQMAVAVFSEAVPLRDYHTVQTVPTLKAKRPDSRRKAFAMAGRQNLNTMITHRDYLCDVCFGVALWAETPPLPLEQLAKAMRRPAFTPYLGRKSCPLSAPLAPKITSADTPAEALMQTQLPEWLEQTLAPRAPLLVASDPHPGQTAGRIETRWDIPRDRQSWHFAPRSVEILTPREET